MYLFCKKWIKAVLILPTLLIFLGYTLYPIIYLFITSLKNISTFQDLGFVGLNNYIYIFQDPTFYKTLLNAVIIVGCELLILLPFGFLLGMLIYTKFRGNTLIKVVTFIPYILSGIMVAIIWTFLVDPGYGMINQLLKSAGLKFLALQWIGGTKLTPFTVALVDSWRCVGFYGILFYTGLKMLPKDSLEAAKIDGASGTQRVFYIMLPQLKETIKISTIMIIINSFVGSYQTVKMLTNGEPNNQSHVITTYLYKLSFEVRDFGKGAVLAIILLILVLAISIPIMSFSNKRLDE